MQVDSKPYRISHRLRGFDYSAPDAYFITICAYRKQCLWGTVESGQMRLNALGEIVHDEWLKTAKLRPGIRLGVFEVMPNHMHGIIVIETRIFKPSTGDLPVAPTGPRMGSLGAIIGNFKGTVTGKVRRVFREPGFQVWQRDFYDHIIRDDDDWERIRAYILENPTNWSSDPENPSNRK